MPITKNKILALRNLIWDEDVPHPVGHEAQALHDLLQKFMEFIDSEILDEDWFFTFGVGQRHAGRFVKIRGSEFSTRQIMFKEFGSNWSMQYPSEGFAGIAVKWNWEELII